MNSPFAGVKELAQFLGMSTDFVYEKSNPEFTTDYIPHFKMGKKIKFKLDSPELQAWIQRQFIQSHSPSIAQGGAADD